MCSRSRHAPSQDTFFFHYVIFRMRTPHIPLFFAAERKILERNITPLLMKRLKFPCVNPSLLMFLVHLVTFYGHQKSQRHLRMALFHIPGICCSKTMSLIARRPPLIIDYEIARQGRQPKKVVWHSYQIHRRRCNWPVHCKSHTWRVIQEGRHHAVPFLLLRNLRRG